MPKFMQKDNQKIGQRHHKARTKQKPNQNYEKTRINCALFHLKNKLERVIIKATIAKKIGKTIFSFIL